VSVEFAVVELVGVEAIWESNGSGLRRLESGSQGLSDDDSCCVAIEHEAQVWHRRQEGVLGVGERRPGSRVGRGA